MVSKAQQKKQNLIQAYNFEFAMVSIIALVIVTFLPIFVDPLLNRTSYEVITTYVKISNALIAVFGLLAIYTGVRGWEMALKKTHKTVYVIALSVGLLSVVQFIWMGLPTILS